MSFDNGEAWSAMKKKLKAKDVELVMMNGPEVGRVRALGGQGKQQAKMIFHGNFNGPVFFGYSAEQSQGLM